MVEFYNNVKNRSHLLMLNPSCRIEVQISPVHPLKTATNTERDLQDAIRIELRHYPD